jgi:hypothetical protein
LATARERPRSADLLNYADLMGIIWLEAKDGEGQRTGVLVEPGSANLPENFLNFHDDTKMIAALSTNGTTSGR